MDIVWRWGFYSQSRQTTTQRNIPTKEAEKATCSMFFLLLAGIISNLIHVDVKPQLHLQSCLAAGLCLVRGPLSERETEQRIIDNVLSPLPLLASFRLQMQSSTGTKEVDTIWAEAAIIVPTGFTGGNAISHSQESRNYIHDIAGRAQGAVHGADIHCCNVKLTVRVAAT